MVYDMKAKLAFSNFRMEWNSVSLSKAIFCKLIELVVKKQGNRQSPFYRIFTPTSGQTHGRRDSIHSGGRARRPLCFNGIAGFTRLDNMASMDKVPMLRHKEPVGLRPRT
jgi:hypothetical protein